jgi:SAM-dependent MidA family methyltransferase
VSDAGAGERFDRYQARCLYDADAGFYATGGRAGRRGGDFITSPEVGPLFGEVLARAIRGWWDDAGRPDHWTVAEAGAGRGALAASILRAEASVEVPLHYVCVERSAALRAAATDLLSSTLTSTLHTSRSVVRDITHVLRGARQNGVEIQVDVVEDLPGEADVILANELLDNLPVRIVERTADGWNEVWVPDELRPTALALDVDAPIGTRLPVLEHAATWVEHALDRAPRVVAFDYGVRTTAELIERPWLRTYAEHGRDTDPYVEPGTVDITVDVPVDQLPQPTDVVTQAEFLARWGIDELVEEGRRIWTERAHIGDLAAVRARSRITEAEALVDPTGLGAFLAMEWSRG